jgi:SAM-dependent methyltransferase
MERILAGELLQKCRITYLSEATSAREVLILGVGAGRFLRAMAEVNPAASVTVVDSSAKMLAVAKQNLDSGGSVFQSIQFICQDALDWRGGRKPFDLIVTHFFFDCFRGDQLGGLVDGIAASASDSAQWLVADFRVPEAGWQRARAQIVLRMAYLFFRVATRLQASSLVAPDPYLSAAGFRLAKRNLSNWGLLHSDLWVR